MLKYIPILLGLRRTRPFSVLFFNSSLSSSSLYEHNVGQSRASVFVRGMVTVLWKAHVRPFPPSFFLLFWRMEEKGVFGDRGRTLFGTASSYSPFHSGCSGLVASGRKEGLFLGLRAEGERRSEVLYYSGSENLDRFRWQFGRDRSLQPRSPKPPPEEESGRKARRQRRSFSLSRFFLFSSFTLLG